MFGLIVSGRPVDAAPQAITDTQYAFRVPANPAFNHIVVFLLPGTQLPLDAAATVYVQLPFASEFKLLGGIGAGKESAIFKISGLKSGAAATAAAAGDGDMMTDDAGVANGGGLGSSAAAGSGGGEIVVGVSIEPAAQVEAQLAQLKGSAAPTASIETLTAVAAAPSTALVRGNTGAGDRVTTKVLAQRIIGNAFNFLASFGSDTVPLKAFQDWWTKFEKKVELDPSFLERGE